MNGADSEPRRQLPMTAAREMTASQPKWRQLCVEYGGLLEIVFFAIKVTFAGYQFMTDFYSQNRCVCSTRSHGPLLCAFCLSFHFKINLCHCLPIHHQAILIQVISTVYYVQNIIISLFDLCTPSGSMSICTLCKALTSTWIGYFNTEYHFMSWNDNALNNIVFVLLLGTCHQLVII